MYILTYGAIRTFDGITVSTFNKDFMNTAYGMCVMDNGDVYLSRWSSPYIQKISNEVVSDVFTDGLLVPSHMQKEGSNILVCDYERHLIDRIFTASETKEVFVGIDGVSGNRNSLGSRGNCEKQQVKKTYSIPIEGTGKNINFSTSNISKTNTISVRALHNDNSEIVSSTVLNNGNHTLLITGVTGTIKLEFTFQNADITTTACIDSFTVIVE